MLHEITRKTIQLSKYEDIDIVWHNNVLTVRCDSGLHLYDFSYNLKCLDKTIDFVESKILTSKCSPITDFFPKDGITQVMRNMEISEMVLDPALWPHNKQLMNVAIIVAFEWSPVDFIHNNESVLATVNSAGNIDIYAQSRHKWSKLENLSLKLKNELNSKIPKLIPDIPYSGKINFRMVKEAAYAIETSSICWSPILNEDKSCNFVTGQRNGYILMWCLKYENESIRVKLLHHTTEHMEEIVTMKWITLSANEFILITSNLLGQIFAYQCEIINDEIKIFNIHPLWPHKDRMVAQYIQYEYLNDSIIIICNKHRHLLLLMIDKKCSVLLQSIIDVKDQRITSVLKNKNTFYISTVNREVYEVRYAIENKSLEIQLVPIEIKGMNSKYELYGVAFSTNNIILASALLDRTILYRKLPLKLDIVFYTEESHDFAATIINNPCKTISNSWDLIELLRCKILKSKLLPQLDYENFYVKAQLDIFYGKVYLILLYFYHSLEITIQNSSRFVLPEMSIDIVKSNIIACYTVEFIKRLCKDYPVKITENNPDTFELQCLYMAGVYLKEFCDKNKQNLNNLLSPDIMEILRKLKDPQYTCQWCDNKLIGFTCKDKHLNSFCSLSFTPIESNEYLVCKSCGATARSELYLDKPKCIFCDLYLCYCYLPL